MVGLGGVLVPPGGAKATEEGKCKASKELRITMEGMEVVKDEMNKGGVV